MALTDIIRRIEDDADADGKRLVEDARAEAALAIERARERAAAEKEDIVRRATEASEREHDTRVANARLAARDRTVSARLELVQRVLRLAVERLEGLGDEEYAALIASRVAAAARGGETLFVGKADGSRLDGRLAELVASELAAAGRKIEIATSDEPAGTERGVVLATARTSLEVSASSMVAERREELSARIASALFGEGEEDW